ncbi:MAG: thioesterase family protein [Lachnospiraceae bacterium]|nr:thioesterase family protein [Lachnospiraceae bacterium]
MNTGIKGHMEITVTDNLLAENVGSGSLRVFATPAMIALIEETAWKSVAPALDFGDTTVGTMVNIEHTAPTLPGKKVTCDTELISVEGRKLVFKATVSDEKGEVGHGTHERFVVNSKTFMEKANK